MTPSKKRIALIGHRGVGKTSLLSRIERYYGSAGKRAYVFDLDQEIMRALNRSVSDIFSQDGEAEFRKIEFETFEKLERKVQSLDGDVFLALGAGFAVDRLPRSWRALWVRRATDATGRVFVDRPRLDADLSPLEEFQKRSLARTPQYAARADETLILDEGIDGTADKTECEYFLGQLHDLGGVITLTNDLLTHDFERWCLERLKWGVGHFEFRDDLLSEAQFAEAAKHIPDSRRLISFRNVAREAATMGFLKESLAGAFDWPVERGLMTARPSGPTAILSLHAKSASVAEALTLLTKFGAAHGANTILKAALPIENFDELRLAHRWQQEETAHRWLLPMSSDGRWAWYRLLQANEYGFFRESEGSAPDQPTLLQWARRRKNMAQGFAAVLGDPVSHSRTPMEQTEFFSHTAHSVFAIKVTEAEAKVGAIRDLVGFGLRWAAVTSPLKTIAFSQLSLDAIDSVSQELKSVNTLSVSKTGAVEGTNTDLEGLRLATEDLRKSQGKIAVWGGGGTLEVLRKVFPDAGYYSARTGELRTGGSGDAPEIVIWAAGLAKDTLMPPSSWTPKTIFDLNYSESSPARMYALASQSRYISGIAMFRAQAKAQREFWKKQSPGEL